MQFKVFGQTDVGLKREINQDTILVDQDLKLYIVADGMGGHKGGEVASAMAVEAVQDTVRNRLQARPDFKPEDLLVEAYTEASSRIHQRSTHDDPDLRGMGTTMVVAFAHKGTMYIANVGDSRAYLFKKPNLWLITEDHSLINEQIRAGVISAKDAHLVVGKNVITRSVGFEKHVKVDIFTRQIEENDVYLLCSDGLCGLLEDFQIASLLNEYPLEELVTRCISAAKDAGGDDNISVMVVAAER